MPTLALTIVAVGSAWFLFKELRAVWSERRDNSRRARRRRFRVGAWICSYFGVVLIASVQIGWAPLWVADAGIGVLFIGWIVFAILTLGFALLEGVEEARKNRQYPPR